MKSTIRTLFCVALLNQAASAIYMGSEISIEQDTDICTALEESEPIHVRQEGAVIENMIITAPPDSDYALRVTKPNVKIRNVIIYHPANGKGIYAQRADNLELENVEVIAYGAKWGANPCPVRYPLNGYRCMNIELLKTNNAKMRNVRVENGSTGIKLWHSPGTFMQGVNFKNMRGPFPAGECIQVVHSSDSELHDFHCFNDVFIAHTQDNMSAFDSDNVVFKNGVVDGNNGLHGMAVMFEGHESPKNGRIEDVEVIHSQGCFSGYPAADLYMKNLTCAQTLCKSDGIPRGGKKSVPNWTGGYYKDVVASNIQVHESYYYDTCAQRPGEIKEGTNWEVKEGTLMWEREEGVYTHFDVSELTEFEPRDPPRVDFSWDECDFKAPDISCHEFKDEPIAGRKKIDANSGLDLTETIYGDCWGWQNWLY